VKVRISPDPKKPDREIASGQNGTDKS